MTDKKRRDGVASNAKRSLINPMTDTLAAGWLGKRNPERKDREDSGPPVHYTELDETLRRVQAIYGDQEEKPKRSGRKG